MVTRSALLLALLVLASSTSLAMEKAPANKKASASAEPTWINGYSAAMQKAKADQKLLLVHFCQSSNSDCAAIERTLAQSQSRQKLNRYVLARVETNETIESKGGKVKILEHPSFSELRGGPGLAVIDMAHKNKPYYGHVVSAVPTAPGRFYQFRPEHVPVVLDLPPGTLTQRTMIFAVRTHHSKPASTHGEPDPVLFEEAMSHSQHQARIRRQGHHNWGSRFHRIGGRLSRGGAPVEIVAESWPGQDLTDACFDCIESWRQSSGHWRNVRRFHTAYGYDIRKGENGIWYATGIFAD